jgi:N-acetyl-gamma-glutamylphosphate reductase
LGPLNTGVKRKNNMDRTVSKRLLAIALTLSIFAITGCSENGARHTQLIVANSQCEQKIEAYISSNHRRLDDHGIQIEEISRSMVLYPEYMPEEQFLLAVSYRASEEESAMFTNLLQSLCTRYTKASVNMNAASPEALERFLRRHVPGGTSAIAHVSSAAISVFKQQAEN